MAQACINYSLLKYVPSKIVSSFNFVNSMWIIKITRKLLLNKCSCLSQIVTCSPQPSSYPREVHRCFLCCVGRILVTSEMTGHHGVAAHAEMCGRRLHDKTSSIKVPISYTIFHPAPLDVAVVKPTTKYL